MARKAVVTLGATDISAGFWSAITPALEMHLKTVARINISIARRTLDEIFERAGISVLHINFDDQYPVRETARL